MKRLIIYTAALITSLVILSPHAARADAFDVLRQKWVDDVTSGPTITTYQTNPTYSTGINNRLAQIKATAVANYESLNQAGGRTYLWSDLQTKTDSSQATSNFTRLEDMAIAAMTPGITWVPVTTGTEPSLADLKASIVSAMDWMRFNWYTPSTSPVGNWWDWQIGCPQAMLDIMALLYSNFTPLQIDNYSASIFHQIHTSIDDNGANGVWQAQIWMLIGIVRKNLNISGVAYDYLDDVQNIMNNELSVAYPIGTVTDAGQFWDGSFIMHNYYPYNGGYAIDDINGLVTIHTILLGSSWAPLSSRVNNIAAWVYATFDDAMYKGNYFQNVLGRYLQSSAHSLYSLASRADTTANGIIRLAEIDNTSTVRTALRDMVKEWNLSNPGANMLTSIGSGYLSIQTWQLWTSITNDSSYVRRGSLNNYTQYPNLDAAIAHRPAWAACVAMYNLDSTGSRMPIRSNETLSSETLLGAHRSDGFLQLMNDDLTHWNNDYWNNVDWDALPGTTEASGIAIPSGGESYTNGSNWAGGAGVDEFGVSGLELMPTNTTVFGYLHALKGWFFFDNEIVCLGADIRKTNAAETHKFHTIVENWKLKSDNSNVFTVDGTTQPTTAGWTANFTPTWANLSGSVTGTNTGYYFPAAGQSVAANRILTGGVYFLEMYINHGIPSAGSYQYVVLPNMTAAQTQTYASAPPISVLENTSSAMAVQKASVGVTSALFWQSVGHTVNLSGSSALSSNKAAAVVVHKTTGQLKIGISDPSQNPSAGTASITVWPNLTGTITGTVSVDSGVTVTQTTPTLILKVSFLGTSGGKTFNASFTTSP